MSNRDLAKQMDTIARRQTTVGALVTYLRPRLAMDAGFSIAKVLEGIPVGPKFDKAVVVKRIRDQAKLAQDADLKDLEKVVEHVEPNEKEGTDASVSSEQHNAMQAAAHGQSSLGIPEKVGEEFVEKDKGKAFDAAGFANFLKSKGMDEATVNEAMSMLPKPTGMDESDEEKRKREEEEAAKKTAADAEAAAKEKDMVTKPAMDAAIAAATEATEKRVRENMRAVAAAQAEVRPWVGDLAPSMAFDSAPDVFRHALTMLGVEGAKTLHNDALRPVLMAQPKPGSSPRTPVLAHDAAASKGFAERFPTATRIG